MSSKDSEEDPITPVPRRQTQDTEEEFEDDTQRPEETQLLEPASSRDTSRRRELTPGRRVTFEGTSEEEEPEESKDREITRLRRSLLAAEIRTELLQKEVGSRRDSRSSIGSFPGEGPIRAKLEKPWTFTKEYRETLNCQHWLRACKRYLAASNVPKEMWTEYARSYMSPDVQVWVDTRFDTEAVPWDTFTKAVQERFLPPDHDHRVHEKFTQDRKSTRLNSSHSSVSRMPSSA